MPNNLKQEIKTQIWVRKQNCETFHKKIFSHNIQLENDILNTPTQKENKGNKEYTEYQIFKLKRKVTPKVKL